MAPSKRETLCIERLCSIEIQNPASAMQEYVPSTTVLYTRRCRPHSYMTNVIKTAAQSPTESADRFSGTSRSNSIIWNAIFLRKHGSANNWIAWTISQPIMIHLPRMLYCSRNCSHSCFILIGLLTVRAYVCARTQVPNPNGRKSEHKHLAPRVYGRHPLLIRMTVWKSSLTTPGLAERTR